MQSKALIIIDFEKEWVNKDSEYFVGDISEVIKKTNQLIDVCRISGYKIIFTTHVEKNSDGAFAQNTENTEIIDTLHKKVNDILISKNKISPFFKTTLEQDLQGIDEVVVCGILTNLCVRSAVQDAYDRDFTIKVIKDCCVSFDTKTQEFTFSDLKATREEVEFLNLDELIENK
ncbi:MAG: isochorismatase family cysteine hydrolase [Patescibacteria group bacterium]